MIISYDYFPNIRIRMRCLPFKFVQLFRKDTTFFLKFQLRVCNYRRNVGNFTRSRVFLHHFDSNSQIIVMFCLLGNLFLNKAGTALLILINSRTCIKKTSAYQYLSGFRSRNTLTLEHIHRFSKYMCDRYNKT